MAVIGKSCDLRGALNAQLSLIIRMLPCSTCMVACQDCWLRPLATLPPGSLIATMLTMFVTMVLAPG